MNQTKLISREKSLVRAASKKQVEEKRCEVHAIVSFFGNTFDISFSTGVQEISFTFMGCA
jgi:hypothetical protein